MSETTNGGTAQDGQAVRRVILLRHAHAENEAPGGRDFDRSLSSLGQEQCAQAAAWLAEQGLLPSQVLCSPARRCEQTLALVAGALNGAPIQFEPRIYEATPGDLLGVLEPYASVDTVLMVGHNPGLEGLAALLASGRLGGHRGMPTAAIASLCLPAGAALEPDAATMEAFWWP